MSTSREPLTCRQRNTSVLLPRSWLPPVGFMVGRSENGKGKKTAQSTVAAAQSGKLSPTGKIRRQKTKRKQSSFPKVILMASSILCPFCVGHRPGVRWRNRRRHDHDQREHKESVSQRPSRSPVRIYGTLTQHRYLDFSNSFVTRCLISLQVCASKGRGAFLPIRLLSFQPYPRGRRTASIFSESHGKRRQTKKK